MSDFIPPSVEWKQVLPVGEEATHYGFFYTAADGEPKLMHTMNPVTDGHVPAGTKAIIASIGFTSSVVGKQLSVFPHPNVNQLYHRIQAVVAGQRMAGQFRIDLDTDGSFQLEDHGGASGGIDYQIVVRIVFCY